MSLPYYAALVIRRRVRPVDVSAEMRLSSILTGKKKQEEKPGAEQQQHAVHGFPQ